MFELMEIYPFQEEYLSNRDAEDAKADGCY